MPSKKRKVFDLDNLDVILGKTQQWVTELNDSVERCFTSGIDIDFLHEDVLIAITVMKFGFQFLQDTFLALEAVPENCGPWQKEILLQMLSSMRGSKNLSHQQEQIVYCLIKKMGKGANGYATFDVNNKIWCRVLSNKKQTLSAIGCMAPPTKLCYFCSELLQKNNTPSVVTMFAPCGPMPFFKVELRCRSCKINYGITKFGNTTNGYKYYDHIGIIEASNMVYIDRLVMEQFGALR